MKKGGLKILLTFILVVFINNPVRGEILSPAISSQDRISHDFTVPKSINFVPSNNPIAISAGYNHTCAVTAWGGVLCWGWAAYDQLGDGIPRGSNSPIAISELSSEIVEISSGYYHTCALSINGGVKCWGFNQDGQLGNGSLIDSFTPVDVVGLTSGIIAISAGYNHTCAVTAQYKIKCWGDNLHGQLGNGNQTSNSLPVDVYPNYGNAVSVSAGRYHTCALLSSGGVKCWGSNISGELGDGTTWESEYPRNVTNLSSGVIEIDTGDDHSCALLANGKVMCWGANFAGQLGNGTNSPSLLPAEVVGLTDRALTLTVGPSHNCVILESDVISCWGSNRLGQLGDGTSSDSNTPIEVTGVSGSVNLISAGDSHTCASLTDGGVKCWGDNEYGELGDGNRTNISVPNEVVGISEPINLVESSMFSSCAVTETGGVLCWGANESGQLGDGTTIIRPIPVDVIDLYGEVKKISADYDVTCVIMTTGEIKCWGANDLGQLGDGTRIDRYTPVNVMGLTESAIDISTGQLETCAVMESGGVACWGMATSGQVDYVEGLPQRVTKVTVGAMHSCAITEAGEVVCWGDNAVGQLGDGTGINSELPVNVVDLSEPIVDISAGSFHTCAVTETGKVKCWGFNITGALGDGTNIDRYSPVEVISLNENVIKVGAGFDHTCILTQAGNVKCWGSNQYGSLGNGTFESHNYPVDVVNLSNEAVILNVGSYHNCIVTITSTVKCWGDNRFRQLGNGIMLSPVDVIWDLGEWKSTFFPLISK